MATTLDYAALAQRRVGCKVEGYDMITAVTQNAMNKQFAAMWIVEESLRTLEIRNKKTQRVKMFCTMEAPKANLLMGTSNKEVLFFLKLQKGWFEWYNQDIEENQKTAIENWVLAFTVKLDIMKLDSMAIPPRIVDLLRKRGLGEPENYTVQQLLIDLPTAKVATYNEDLSVLPSHSGSDAPVSEVAQMRVAFTNYIKEYLEGIKLSYEGSRTAIGFIPTEFKTRPLSLTPTIVTFQNYPFQLKATDQDVSAETFEGGKHNMLLCLEMTKGRPLPSMALNTSQPWVVPGPDNILVDGCVTLSRKIFLDEWLIPTMIALNRLTDITTGETTYSVAHDECGKPISSATYSWSKELVLDLDYSFQYKGIERGEVVYTFHHLSGALAVDANGLRTHAAVCNYVKIPIAPADGICKILVGGHSKAEVEINGPNIDVYESGEFTWKAAFVFTVNDREGGLMVTMDPEFPTKLEVTGDSHLSNPDGWAITGPDPKEVIQTTFTQYEVAPVLNELNRLFSGIWPLYFRSAGELFFSDPIFNQEGALMLNLTSVKEVKV